MVADIDQRARQLAAERVTGLALLNRMAGHVPDLQHIWTAATDQQLAALCHEYPGFYQYASAMEEAAQAERINPSSAYRDLPH